jgi:large subunit ribosomal protein L4
MATVDVVAVTGSKAGSVELSSVVFEAPVRPHLFHAEVRRQLAARRAGTHSTRNRSGVSGGGVKPWRQKGTGRARQGSIRAPQWAGGGVVFGPVPRGYEHELPKKVRRAALRGALSLRQGEGALLVLQEFGIGEFKTRRVLDLLEKLGLSEHSVLMVTAGKDAHLEISARNLPRVSVVRAEGLNVYDVLRHERLVVAKDALPAIEQRLARGARAGGADA